MAVFGAYSELYDALYKDKDYLRECDFLEQVFSRYAARPVKNILDLGCGTGGHAVPLMQRGYDITGIDQSEGMLAQARLKAGGAALQFLQADIREVDLGRKFDVVIAMFAVMGYMTSNGDLRAALQSARRHLTPGGLFFFDAWYGPAVLLDWPQDRYKAVEVDDERVIRFAHPEMDLLNQVVHVSYKVLQLRGPQIIHEANETHLMRFFFPQEITSFLETAGFGLRKLSPFLRLDDVLSAEDWNMAVVAEAK